MAISIPSALASALDAGGVVMRTGIVFDFPSGIYAFWDGDGDFANGGVTYKPGGGLLEVSEIPAASDMSSAGVTVKLRAIPDDGLSPDVLGTIEAERYHQRPVSISAFFFDVSTRSLIASIRQWSGYLDFIEHDDGPDSYALVANLESRSRDHSKTGYRMHTTADQAQVSPGDLFFQHVSTTSNYTRRWGRA